MYSDGPVNKVDVSSKGGYSAVLDRVTPPKLHPLNGSADSCQQRLRAASTYIVPPLITACCPLYIRTSERHTIGGIPSQMNLNAWRYYLDFEDNLDKRSYLEDGISHGFAIVDDDVYIEPYYCENYSSVLSGQAFNFVDGLILDEIANGKYVLASSIPHCVHSLGAIPKQDGTFRPITDCSKPDGTSINNFMNSTFQTFTYTTIDMVASNLNSGCYMATVDISAAYRSVHIREDQWTYQGIMWPIDGSLSPLWDARLSFGIRCAPYIYTETSNFIARTMLRMGYSCVANYLDDFLVFGNTYSECQQAQMALIGLLGDLGFLISWKKCSTPSTCVRYLGILLDSVEMSLCLPQDKMIKLHRELEFFRHKSRATKNQIQHLCGIIAHCAKVVRGGRTFSRRIIDLLAGLEGDNPRIRLSDEFRRDLEWWYNFAKDFNGKENIIFINNGDGPTVSTDSCLQGYGILSGNDWQAGYFNSPSSPEGLPFTVFEHGHWLNVDVGDATNINYLELVPIWLSLLSFCESWKDSHVLCLTDNTQVVAMLTKGHSINKDCMILLRRIFWICVKHNIYLTPRHIPGNLNIIPDMLSRVCIDNSLSSTACYSLCCSGRVSAGLGSFSSSRLCLVKEHPLDQELSWKRYLKFCTDIGETPVPAAIQTVVRFLVFLARDCKFSTVNNYLSAIVSLHKFYGYDATFRDCFLVELVMKGLHSQLGDHRVQMQPLSLSQLRQIHDTCLHSQLDITMWLIVILSFRSLLRKSNIVPDSHKCMGHALRRKDVSFYDWGIMLHVHSSKTLQYQQYVLDIPIRFVSDQRFCVASGLKRHLLLSACSQDGPLFLKEVKGKWIPILYKEVLDFIKRSVVSIGLPAYKYGVHSLRRSGVAFLHSTGVPLEDLMSIDDWHSLAVLEYLVTPVNRKLDIQDKVVAALASPV